MSELGGAVLRAKTVVIDGPVLRIGPSNTDRRGFVSGNAANAAGSGRAFGQAMHTVFQQHPTRSSRLTPEAGAHRALRRRAKQGAARLLKRWWWRA